MVNVLSPRADSPDPRPISVHGNVHAILKSYLENYHRIMGNSLLHLFTGDKPQTPKRRERRGAMGPLVPGLMGISRVLSPEDRSSITSGFDQLDMDDMGKSKKH
jgi:hypothetical protein